MSLRKEIFILMFLLHKWEGSPPRQYLPLYTKS